MQILVQYKHLFHCDICWNQQISQWMKEKPSGERFYSQTAQTFCYLSTMKTKMFGGVKVSLKTLKKNTVPTVNRDIGSIILIVCFGASCCGIAQCGWNDWSGGLLTNMSYLKKASWLEFVLIVQRVANKVDFEMNIVFVEWTLQFLPRRAVKYPARNLPEANIFLLVNSIGGDVSACKTTLTGHLIRYALIPILLSETT